MKKSLKKLLFTVFATVFLCCSFGSGARAAVAVAEFHAVEGHLTKDDVKDKASISSPCGECEDWDNEENPKLGFTVTINRPDKKPLIMDSPGVLCFRCGGVKGVAITGRPEITAGKVLQISYNGGSRQYWSHLVKWRFDEATESLQLIGYTASIVDTLQEDPNDFADDRIGELISMDINYRTRKVERKVVGKNRKPKLFKCRLPADYKIPSFSDFNYEDFESGGDLCGVK